MLNEEILFRLHSEPKFSIKRESKRDKIKNFQILNLFTSQRWNFSYHKSVRQQKVSRWGRAGTIEGPIPPKMARLGPKWTYLIRNGFYMG